MSVETSKLTEVHSVTPEGAERALRKAIKLKRPLFIWGPPGIGKSEIVESITAAQGGLFIDLRLGQCEPTDLRGIPFFNKDNGRMDWAPPIDLPDEELASQYPLVTLFLDEMNTAPPAVQASAYQLVLNRRVGKYRLPDNVRIIAAGNNESDKGVTYRMPTPLANRFTHIQMRSDFNSFNNWATKKGVHQDVVGYLNFAKKDLMDFDSKSPSKSFATPRSWVAVSEIISDAEDTDPDTLFALIAGTIGDGLAHKFSAHRKVSSKMPDPADILSGKVTELEVKEISAMYSLITNMCYELRDALNNKVGNKKFHEMADNFFRFSMKNFETEIIVMGAKTALKTYELPIMPTELKTFDEFHKKYGKYIVDANN